MCYVKKGPWLLGSLLMLFITSLDHFTLGASEIFIKVSITRKNNPRHCKIVAIFDTLASIAFILTKK
jgi:hypothetical protein